MKRNSHLYIAGTFCIALSACGGGQPSGLYVAEGDAMYDKFDFRSDNKVDVTGFGQTISGEYMAMDDGRIRVMVNNNVITLRDAGGGCLIMAGSPEEEAEARREGFDISQFGRFCED